MNWGRVALIAIAGLFGWLAYFIYGQTQIATAYIEGEYCPELSRSEAEAEGAVFPRIIYGEDDGDHRVYVTIQNDVAGTFDCFVAMNNTRCDLAGPGLFYAEQEYQSAVYRILDGQVAVIQGNEDDLYCTIPDDPSDVDQ